MPEIMIDPITRIEGHLALKVKVEADKVVDAWSIGTLFRGFELIVRGRDPRDAPVITQRICGVCHYCHRLASTLAIEDAAGIIPPENAVRMRNIIDAVACIYSHAASLLVLSGPDFGVYGLAGKPHPRELELDADKYAELLGKVIIPTQRMCHEIMAIFGGKVPHNMTTVVGGVTVIPTADKIAQAYVRMLKIKSTVYDVYTYLKETFIPHLIAEHPDVVNALLNVGVGCKNFVSYGVYPDPVEPFKPEKFFMPRGVMISGAKGPLDVNKISENVKYAWYTDQSGGKPSEEIPLKDAYGKSGAYTWIKAPRYNGNVCEVGPLARMIISGRYTPLSKAGASLYDRLVSRLEELKVLTDAALTWIPELKPGATVYTPHVIPDSAEGTGLWEAPRGALLHYINIVEKKIDRYQCVVPTTWNGSPRDDAGKLGPMEQAVLNTPVPAGDTTNVLRVVRSFDPCIACSVHIINANGKVIKQAIPHQHP